MRFPTIGTDWILDQELLAKLRETYPGLDVERECQKAMLWCTVNPRKRKTARGMPKFLMNWMDTAERGWPQDRRRNTVPAYRPPATTYEWLCPHTPRCGNRQSCAIVAMRKRA